MKIIITIFLINVAVSTYAQIDTSVFKKRYNVFNPTPNYLMREFSTDRPDATESPCTVDAGHFQIETDLFKTEHFNIAGVTTRNNFFNVANLKIGITNSLDLQMAVNCITVSITRNGTSKMKTSGFGGLTLRAKQNLWGNDGGQTALAILPYINIPTKNDNRFSGGILIPVSVSLTHGWEFGSQVGVDIGQTNGYYFDFLSSANLSHSLFENFKFFAEGVLCRNSEFKTYEYFLDGGFVFALSSEIHIDTGIFYGLKSISPTTYFLGASFRF